MPEPKLGVNTGNAGKGRPKGVPNRLAASVKGMILQALQEAHKDGGAAYLREQAEKNPAAFMTLVGKVLPLQLTGEEGGPIDVRSLDATDEELLAIAVGARGAA